MYRQLDYLSLRRVRLILGVSPENELATNATVLVDRMGFLTLLKVMESISQLRSCQVLSAGV